MAKIYRICCVHQGYELYGSDRTFIQCVNIIRSAFPEAHIEIILPRPGPITAYLPTDGCSIHFDDLWVLRKKGLLRKFVIGFPGIIKSINTAFRRMSSADFIYINTSVVLDYLIAARFVKTPAICHVHEIPPKGAMSIIRAMLRWAGVPLIYNSAATCRAFALPCSQKQVVVLNSCQDPISEAIPPSYRGDRPLRLLMIGRLNSWKGHDVLVDALRHIPSELWPAIDVRIVGGTFDNAGYDNELFQLISETGLSSIVTMHDFDPDPSQFYRWSDVVIVPSRKPEPFGLVAIEAFSHARSVIAADHGGLAEIVTPAKDGWRFVPGSAQALSECIQQAMTNPDLVVRYGRQARETYTSRFTEDIFKRNFTDALHELARVPAPAP